MSLQITSTDPTQAPELLALYQQVAETSGGIIRDKDEFSLAYVADFLHKSLHHGIALVGTMNGDIVGEIHAYTPGIRAFQHILADLTIVTHPLYQGRGIGRRLFERFLRIVEESHPHILRVELHVREHHAGTVRFYESLGFVNEGRQPHKIYVSASKFETPLHMAWFNPAYRFQ